MGSVSRSASQQKIRESEKWRKIHNLISCKRLSPEEIYQHTTVPHMPCVYTKCVLPCKETPAFTEQCVCVCVCESELLRLCSGAWSRRKKWVVGCSLLHAIWITACWPGASRAKSQERGFSVWGCDGAIREHFPQRKVKYTCSLAVNVSWFTSANIQAGNRKAPLQSFSSNLCLFNSVDLQLFVPL